MTFISDYTCKLPPNMVFGDWQPQHQKEIIMGRRERFMDGKFRRAELKVHGA